MAFTQKDIYALTNAIVSQLTGEDNITVFDTDSFVSAGELIGTYETENVVNAISIVMGRTFMAVRPWSAKFALINALNTGLYTHRMRKISMYSSRALPSGSWNTDLYTNFAPLYDNGTNGAADETTGRTPSTRDQWEQHPPIPFEMQFDGASVWQEAITIYEDQLKVAFRSEDDFANFMGAIMTQKATDIELQKEAHSRMTMLSRIAMSLAISQGTETAGLKTAIDLKAAYNAFYGTNKTRTQLLTTDLKSFLEFFISEFKDLSDLMTRPSVAYHAAPVKTMADGDHVLLRHTPKSEQRLMMYGPFWKKARAIVMPEIFNTEYLQEPNFESVEFWQSYNNRSAINLKVTVPGWLESLMTDGETTQDTSVTINEAYILGVLFDKDSVMTDYQYESSRSTPVEARKNYRNIWYDFSKNSIVDPSENCIVFYLSADT
jgi:hypothetical protein